MEILRIKRTSEYNNRMRDYKIFIDGQQVGTIANGETKDFFTTDGQHTETAKIDWCSSPNILVDIKKNQPINFKVGGFKNGQLLILTALVVIVLHFIFSKIANFDYLIYLEIPFFLILFYYLTIGRKKYLTLSVLNETN